MKNNRLNRLLGVVLEVAALFAGMQAQPAWAKDASVAEGRSIFQAKCSACHTIGGGRLVGPDLKGVTDLRDHHWLEKFISAPDGILAAGDPIAVGLLKEYGGVAMPNPGLSDSQVDALLAYLEQSAARQGAPLAANANEAATGDKQHGAKLFTGGISFQEGGAPCIACHTVSGIAPLGGGALGPDLTGIYRRLGATGLLSVLTGMPFPTMQPIYHGHALTQSEQADLVALFQAEAGQKPADDVLRMAVLAIAGLALLFVLIATVWRKRFKSGNRR